MDKLKIYKNAYKLAFNIAFFLFTCIQICAIILIWTDNNMLWIKITGTLLILFILIVIYAGTIKAVISDEIEKEEKPKKPFEERLNEKMDNMYKEMLN